MKARIIGIIYGIYLIIIYIVCTRLEKKRFNRKTPKNIIYAPELYFLGGLMSLVIILPCPIVIHFAMFDFYATLFISLLIFLPGLPFSILTLLYGMNWKIEVKEKEFIITNIFKKQKNYKYTDVEIKILKYCYKIYYNNKRICTISYNLHKNPLCLYNRQIPRKNK